MHTPLRFAFLAALSLGLLCSSRTAGAQDTPPAPQPRLSDVPPGATGVYPWAPAPPPTATPAPYPTLPGATPWALPPTKQWYGWRILIPTIALDATMISTFFAGGKDGPYIAFGALVARGITGPIVHLVHGHPLKALGSLALEGALPGVFVGAMYAEVQQCNTSTGDDDFCVAPILTLIVAMPIALTAGAVIDSTVLAWEDRPNVQGPDPKVRWSVAPIALPPLRVGAAHAGPMPMGAGVVGTF